MKDPARIEALYIEIDLQLDRARTGTRGPDAVRIEAEQVIADQAYFLLCWGQFEIEVDRVCRLAITARQSHADWQIRRSWYLYNPKDERLSGLSFEDRVALIVDREDKSKGSPWTRTMFHHTARNEIAHGTLPTTRVDVTAFVADCHLIRSALHRAL